MCKFKICKFPTKNYTYEGCILDQKGAFYNDSHIGILESRSLLSLRGSLLDKATTHMTVRRLLNDEILAHTCEQNAQLMQVSH